MKKLLAVLLSAALALTLCACGTSQSPSESPTTESTAAPITRYPLNADSTYAALAKPLPAHIYTTTGSENGLGGTVYTFSGTVTDYSTTQLENSAVEQIFVETDAGKVMVANFYKWLYNDALLVYGEKAAGAAYPYPVKDYCFPDVGETAEFVAIYVGYSGVAEVPMFYLGANPALFEILEYPDPAQAASTPVENGIYGDAVQMGNLRFQIPDGYTASILNDNTAMLAHDDGSCAIAIFAADISKLDEQAAMAYLPMQRTSFEDDEAVQTERTQPGTFIVGDFTVTVDCYTEMYADLSGETILDATFTDSWYAYTIIMRDTSSADAIESHTRSYAELLIGAQYTGPDPRFDFVQ